MTIRYKIRNLILTVLSEKRTSLSSYLLKIRIFFKDFPWWSEYILNWFDLVLIFFRIKKRANLRFKNGFIFYDCSKNNWKILPLYVNNLIKSGIEIINDQKNFLVKMKNISIKYPNLASAIYYTDEIFISEDYGKFDYNDKIVVDIGGYVGDSSIFFSLKGAKKVYVYEIDKYAFSILKENLKRNQVEDKIVAFNKGVFQESIKTVLAEPIDVLKMDCEGCEYSLINRILRDNLMNKIRDGIVLETHDFDETRNANYLKTLFNASGFKKIYVFGKNKNILQIIK